MYISKKAKNWFYRHHYQSTHPRISSEVHQKIVEAILNIPRRIRQGLERALL